MGTRRRVAIWYQRARREYVVVPPGWKRGMELVFTDQNAMMDFARASRLMLRQIDYHQPTMKGEFA